MSLKLGVYVQLYEGTTNTHHHRLLGDIAINLSNEKGGNYFMYLRTGRKLHGFLWTELTITEEVISRVEELGKEYEHPLMKNGPIFEWIPGNITMDKQYDKEDFNDLLNNLQCRHDNDDNSDYVPGDSNYDKDSIG